MAPRGGASPAAILCALLVACAILEGVACAKVLPPLLYPESHVGDVPWAEDELIVTMFSSSAMIHFTIDGSTPTRESTLYVEGLRITDAGTHHVRAISADNHTTSAEATATYNVAHVSKVGPEPHASMRYPIHRSARTTRMPYAVLGKGLVFLSVGLRLKSLAATIHCELNPAVPVSSTAGLVFSRS